MREDELIRTAIKGNLAMSKLLLNAEYKIKERGGEVTEEIEEELYKRVNELESNMTELQLITQLDITATYKDIIETRVKNALKKREGEKHG